ncbi:YcnI family protein [Umezawaea sp. Da 62-37]|uniref:YcnI family copper-binding membrane protein n=1 Tax=Umezawaea sp. Da 62-37 TaxID=3075927 RepID=UPI0028F6D6EE|nr:YcnI family protein [Umezawaea sp. Da 62-37]WNV91467.1 YcnI family protein [Umezawaea sp. Da 62-37]
MSTNRFDARTFARGAAVLGAAGAIALCTTGLASAHVTASTPSPAAKGGYTKVTIRVPNERPDAGTVKLELTLPPEYPLASVSSKPVPGWKAEVVKAKLPKPITSHGKEITEAPSTVTWTADAGVQIEPGQFNEFDLSVGPLPEDTDRLLLVTKQTYSSGEVVAWDAPPAAEGADEPAKPAPVLNLVAKAADGDHHDASAATATASDEHAEAAVAGKDNTARYLGGAGLAVGALGLGFGAGAVLRSRRSTGKPAA